MPGGFDRCRSFPRSQGGRSDLTSRSGVPQAFRAVPDEPPECDPFALACCHECFTDGIVAVTADGRLSRRSNSQPS